MTDVAIRVEGLGKRYRLGRREPYFTMRDALARSLASLARVLSGWGTSPTRPGTKDDDVLWALRDVSFDAPRGEAIGIIGANAAGKSTLLKILSRITEPTEGRAEIAGRVGSLLEVGTGFHPELTGRENVFLNGAILGMTRAEIRTRFDQIVSFAGMDRFIDTPAKHYSSGMYMRLAFSVAAHLRTEVLLVDEVLAVGDAAFQLRCLNKMAEVSGEGRTVLFVSHNMDAVARLCGRGVLLVEGRVAALGGIQECIDQYLTTVRQQRLLDGRPVMLRSHPGRTKALNGLVRLTSLAVADAQGRLTWTVSCGKALTVILGYEMHDRSQVDDVTFSVGFSNSHNHPVTACRSHDTYGKPMRLAKDGKVLCRISRLPLVPGLYHLNLGCNTEAGWSDGVYDAATIEVIGSDFYASGQAHDRALGDVLLDHEWEPVTNAAPPLTTGRPKTFMSASR